MDDADSREAEGRRGRHSPFKRAFRGSASAVDKNGKEASTLIVDDVAEAEPPTQPETGSRSEVAILCREYLAAYDRLADAVPATRGFDGKSVRKVSANAIKDELKNRGFLDMDGRERSPARREAASHERRPNCSEKGSNEEAVDMAAKLSIALHAT